MTDRPINRPTADRPTVMSGHREVTISIIPVIVIIIRIITVMITMVILIIA